MNDGNMYEILKDINEWQDVVFKKATPQSASAHLRREANELYESPYDAEEMADIFILLAGVAHLAGVDLVEAVEKKMAINRKRIWGEPDEEGVIEHVRNTLVEVFREDIQNGDVKGN